MRCDVPYCNNSAIIVQSTSIASFLNMVCLFRSLADLNLSSILGDQVAVERERQAEGAAAGAISTMLVAEVTRAESLNYGVAVVDERTRQVLHFVEKPSTFVASTISCGVYLFSPAIFEQIKGVYEHHLGMC